MRTPYKSDIVGLSHYCDDSDKGHYKGFIKPEPDNKFDPNAVAVYLETERLIGYIPSKTAPSVLWWLHGRDSARCDISLTAGWPKGLNGKTIIYDDSYDVPHEWDFSGECCWVVGSTPFHNNKQLKGLLKNLGLTPAGQMSKKVKIVSFWDNLPDDFLHKYSEDDGYSYLVLNLQDLISRALPPCDRNEFTGKEVAFAYKAFNDSDEDIVRWLIEHGAKVADRYKKSTTDIVIDRDKTNPLKTAEKALLDGKIVMSITDIAEISGIPYDIKLEKTADKSSSNIVDTTSLDSIFSLEEADLMREKLTGVQMNEGKDGVAQNSNGGVYDMEEDSTSSMKLYLVLGVIIAIVLWLIF